MTKVNGCMLLRVILDFNYGIACFVAMLDEANDLVAGVADMDICKEIHDKQIRSFDLASNCAGVVLDGNLSEKTIARLTARSCDASVPVFFEPGV